MSTAELECRLGLLETYFKFCSDTQFRIERIDDKDEGRIEIDDLFLKTKSLLINILGDRRQAGINDSVLLSSPSASIPQRLMPSLNLPKFSGRYCDFKQFIGNFNAVVGSNSNICNIEKFSLLLQCLSGQAKESISMFPISSENYAKAIERLESLYNNECLIFFDHLNNLFNIERIAKPTQPALRSVVDKVTAIYSAMKSLGTTEQICDALLIQIVMSKIDCETKCKWEESLDYKKLPSWSDCSALLDRRCQQLEATKSCSTNSNSKSNSPRLLQNIRSPSRSFKTHVCAENKKRTAICLCCKEANHMIYKCPQFLSLNAHKRLDKIKELQLCTNCFGDRHTNSNCLSKYSCKTCHKRHHSLLHVNDPANDYDIDNLAANNSNAMQISHNQSQVILATALVLVKDNFGTFQLARALLDSCSQVNFMREEFARSLHLKQYRKTIEIDGINGAHTTLNAFTTTAIRSRLNTFEATLDFMLTPSVSNYENFSIDINYIPKNLELADPHFGKRSRIDLLIGGELFFDLLAVGQIKLNNGGPMLQKSKFGWLVVGRCNEAPSPGTSKMYSCCSTTSTQNLDKLVSNFWKIEDVNFTQDVLMPDERKCVELFRETTTTQSGRIIVQLPLNSKIAFLGESYNTALRRFVAIERRLIRNPEIYSQYVEFMREYEKLNHMHKVESFDLKNPHYFIPHHFVLKPESTSTKLRVVFDASCKTSSGVSLNDALMIGPTIQKELLITLLRFRVHRYAITADVVKMYRQVLIDPTQRNFQLILWRENQNDPIQTFALNTVTYGTSSASFLAIRSLQYAAEMYAEEFPMAAEVVINDFYVDDMLSGANDPKTLAKIQTDVQALLQRSGFALAKWHSNYPYLLDSQSSTPPKSLKVSNIQTTSTLGISWDSNADDFNFTYKPKNHTKKCSKRTILSQSATLFDPMGLLSPLIIRAKILLQELWLLKIDWDESVPQAIHTVWKEFVFDLTNLHRIRVPRYILHPAADNIQVHGFCDASIRAYGCVIYVRCEAADRTIYTQILVSKSRVAPLKVKTLPRLELCGAHLLVKLWDKIQPHLNISINSVFFWCDSQVVLHWIKSHSSTLNTFVGNRVAEIQELSSLATWRYVPSSSNPADMVSRGATVDELCDSRWSHGPAFLQKTSTFWPKSNEVELSPEEKYLERKQHVLMCNNSKSHLLEIIHKCSTYTKIIRIFAYVIRFIRIKCKRERVAEQFTAFELSFSLKIIVSIVQRYHFASDISALKRQQPVASNLTSLCPFIDSSDAIEVLRVGGRLQNAEYTIDVKHPMLLPKNDPFVICMMRYFHTKNYHAGPKTLVALTRQLFWVINAPLVASKVVNKCLHCIKYKPKMYQQVMGNLPKSRITNSRPFQFCGVDFCGPISTYLNIRGKRPYKTYIAVFICFATKAVHLEPVSDLSSNKFIEALKRLSGRRGTPTKIFCDNATNFVGASSALKELYEKFLSKSNLHDVNSYCAQNFIQFEFIPPRAPHFGGLWEAAVKVPKGLFLRTLSSAHLTYEGLYTALIEIESIMNSRPLTPLSSNANDFEALTPAHFLFGTSLSTIPEPSIKFEDDISYLQKFQRINAAKCHFWERWRLEYLHELQNRVKWRTPNANIEVGALVLIHENNVPPLSWQLGRIIKIITGADGYARVAEIQTQHGVKKRAIHKLAPIPVY